MDSRDAVTDEDPDARYQIFARDTRLPATAPLVRLGVGEADCYRAAAHAGHLVCPVPGCSNPKLIVRGTPRVRDHFAHRPGGSSHAPESLKHIQGKHQLAALYASAPGAEVRFEETLPGGARRADVLVTGDDRQLGIEVQAYAMTDEAFAARRRDYADAGVEDLWVWLWGTPHVRRPRLMPEYGGKSPFGRLDYVVIGSCAETQLKEQGGVVLYDAATDQLGIVLRGLQDAVSLDARLAFCSTMHTLTQPIWLPRDQLTISPQLQAEHPRLRRARRQLVELREQEQRAAAERKRRLARAQQRKAIRRVPAVPVDPVLSLAEELDAECVREQMSIAEHDLVAALRRLRYQRQTRTSTGSDESATLLMHPDLIALRVARIVQAGVGDREEILTRFLATHYDACAGHDGLWQRRLGFHVRTVDQETVTAGVARALRALQTLGLITWPEQMQQRVPERDICWTASTLAMS